MKKTFENIYITEDAPLIVSSDDDTMHYGMVYMEEGAYIEIRAGAKFIIEKLCSAEDCDNMKEVRKNCVLYPTRKDGESLRDTQGYDIIVTTRAGKDGERGNNGGVGGGEGQYGTDGISADSWGAEQFLLAVEDLEKNIRVLSVGGNGGNGGTGGSGGDGWDGIQGKNNGTAGGDGGAGGNGGDASDAVKHLYVRWESTNGSSIQVDCLAAKGGTGGCGGLPGRNGSFYAETKIPEKGKDGQNGADGTAGDWQRVLRLNKENRPMSDLYEKFGRNEDTGKLNEHFKLDFADPQQAEAFLESLGGKEYLESRYPRLYAAYQKTVSNACMKRDSGVQPDGTISDTFMVTALNCEKNTTTAKRKQYSAEDSIPLEVFNYTEIHDAEARFSYITGEIFDLTDNLLIESTAYTSSEKDMEFKLATDPLEYVGMDGKEFNEISCRSFVTGDGLLGMESKSTDALLINGMNSLIKNITIEKPKSAYNNHPLIFLYNRQANSDESADYSYNEDQVQYNSKDNTVNTLLGIKGTIEFNEKAGVVGICGFAAQEDTDNRRLLVNETGAAEYNYNSKEIAEFFSPKASEDKPSSELKVSFDFPDDWRYRLNKNVYDAGAKNVLADLVFSFRYNVKLKDPKSGAEGICGVPITIKSVDRLQDGKNYYTADNSTSVYIPQIKIRWGCFAADTMIEMGDGRTKEISHIKKGDMVMTPKGARPVREVYYGTERMLICIETESGHSIRVTEDHPMLVRRGVVRAGKLDIKDQICMADGTFETIRNVYEAEYIEDQEVYNIDVEGGLILADGFLSGEFGTQNDLSILEKNSVFAEYGVCKEQKQKQSVFSEEANSVVEEFVELLHEKYGVCTAPSAVPGRKCK